MKTLPFDKIYIINLVSNKERHDNCIKEFGKLGVDKTDLNFWYATRNNFLTNIETIIPTLRCYGYDEMQKRDLNTYSRIFDNAYAHFNIIKTSYERGFNSILVCEDDVNFIDDKNLVLDTFNKIPQDYDIIKFYNMCDAEYFKKNVKRPNTEKIHYILEPSRGYLGTAMIYALSRNGMKIYIDYVEKNGLLVSDDYFIHLFKLCKLYSLDGCIIKHPIPFGTTMQIW